MYGVEVRLVVGLGWRCGLELGACRTAFMAAARPTARCLTFGCHSLGMDATGSNQHGKHHWCVLVEWKVVVEDAVIDVLVARR